MFICIFSHIKVHGLLWNLLILTKLLITTTLLKSQWVSLCYFFHFNFSNCNQLVSGLIYGFNFPIDLNRIGKNVVNKKYKTLTQFIRDMILVFENCRYYNPRESQFYKCAELLEQFFVSKLKSLRDKFCEQYMEA